MASSIRSSGADPGFLERGLICIGMQRVKCLVSQHINLFKPNGMSRSYQLDQSISILRGVG